MQTKNTSILGGDSSSALSTLFIVTDKAVDQFGRTWGKINGVRVMLTYAVDPQGSWVDDNGNYHFNAH